MGCFRLSWARLSLATLLALLFYICHLGGLHFYHQSSQQLRENPNFKPQFKAVLRPYCSEAQGSHTELSVYRAERVSSTESISLFCLWKCSMRGAFGVEGLEKREMEDQR